MIITSNRKFTQKASAAGRVNRAAEGFDPACGARPLKRLIQKEIQDVLALKLLEGDFHEGQTIEVDEKDGALTFTAVSAPDSAEGAEEREKV